ncbi:DUF2786 domain-containing protein [Streptomyces sp. NPDC056796]|uniref:DUF2786 domain-containing protein n=1 Tax=Streptomyces sp. NPDC056796 TaxID=3345947 RepID=UPI0036CB209E
MSLSDNPQLAKIRALMAKAEDPAATKEEAEAFFAKATALMSKYGIERAMLAAADPNRDKVGHRSLLIEGVLVEERQLMAGLVAKAVNIEPILNKVRKPGSNRFTYLVELYGFESDIERVEMLYTSLSLQASNFLRTVGPAWWEETPKATYRKRWFRGFTNEVVARLKDAEARAKGEAEAKHGTSVALVLASRAELARKAADNSGFKTADYQARNRVTDAFKAGQQAGRTADIGAKRLAGGRRALSR